MFGRVPAQGPFPRLPGRALLLPALVACLCAAPAHAQRLPITSYTTRDGLPHYVVNRIVRDSRGFLWFCTREGLARFDGREFVRFGTEHGLPSARINDLVEARDGTLWVATAGGLTQFDPRRGTVARSFTTHLDEDDRPPANVTRLALDPSGDLWVGTTTGAYRARLAKGASLQFEEVSLQITGGPQAGGVAALLADRAGALWVASGTNLYRREPNGTVTVVGETDRLPATTISDMLDDGAGRIWLATGRGLLCVEAAGTDGGRRVSTVLDERNGLPSPVISSLLLDTRGVLWAGTSKGLVEVRPDAWASVSRVRVIAEAQGLPGVEIQGLAQDTHGNLWVGVLPFGAAKISSNGFTVFGLPVPRTFPSTLLETRGGDLLAMGLSAGRWSASRFDGERFVSIPGAQPEGTPTWAWNQLALQDRSGSWWFGTNEGLLRYAPGIAIEALRGARPRARYSRANGLPADVVLRVFEDARGDIWVSTVGHGERPNGLSLWRRNRSPALVPFTERDGLPALDQFFASSFAEDGAGHVWIGFSGEAGLVRYDGTRFERFTARHGVPPGQIRNLLADSQGRLWAATYRSGLCRVDRPETSQPQFRAYTTADGLSSNETHALVEGREGELYVGTARGLDRLAVATGRWTHYTAHDGLPPGEMQGALRDRHGTLWFAYNDAVLRLLPTPERAPVEPQVFIDAIDVSGLAQPVSAISERDAGPLVIPSGATLRVGFVAPWFGAPADFGYEYRLDGAEPEWVGPTDHRDVTYASMAPGTYTFRVRTFAAGAPGPRSASLSLTVVPPVWRRTSFLVGLACVAALLAYGGYRVRLRRVTEFANMRTRIATDLHDDIGANLTRIGILSEVVRHQLAPKDSADDARLASIARLARESVGAMSDIVWAINPERDTLVDLARKIRDFAEDLASGSDIELDAALPDSAANLRVDMDVRRDVFLICKEALTNAVRHARCRRLRVALGSAGGRLTLEVVDDGVGFDPDRGHDGNGLVSMHRRAARIGARLSVKSTPGRGTAVRLDSPLGRTRWTHAAGPGPTPPGR